MDNSTFNAKIEPTLRAALDTPNSEWNTSGDLLTGFDPATRLWELILFYSGDASALQETFPEYRFTFLQPHEGAGDKIGGTGAIPRSVYDFFPSAGDCLNTHSR